MATQLIPYGAMPAGSDYGPSSYYGGSVYSSRSRQTPSRAGSDYSTTSTAKTFGDPTRAYYAPGQAPPRYFDDVVERQQWDSVPRSSDGKKYRVKRRLQNSIGDDVVMDSRFEAGSSEDRRGSSGSSRSSRSLFDDDRTLVPEDSISSFSTSQRGRARQSSRSSTSSNESSGSSRGSRRGEQIYYDQERTVISSSSRRGSGLGRVQVANERLVIEFRPTWAR